MPAEIRDCMDYADAYDPVADEFEATAHFIRHSVAVARAKVPPGGGTPFTFAGGG